MSAVKDPMEIMNAIKKRWSEDPIKDTFNCMLLGKPGTGKTFSLRTARRPILYHSFDPNGVSCLRDFIMSDKNPDGFIIAESRFQIPDTSSEPRVIKEWEAEFNMLYQNKFFANIGTYVIDSATTFIQAILNEILKRNGRGTNGIPQIQDYQHCQIYLTNMIKKCFSLPCDFVFIGHIDMEKDETTGKMEAGIAVSPSLRKFLPTLFEEIYVATTSETSKGIDYKFITANTGQYQARSRLSKGGLLDTYEVPDFKAILKKVGYSTEDRTILSSAPAK